MSRCTCREITLNTRRLRVDKNQKAIVEALRKIPGVSVAVGHDDILVGHRGKTRWYEIKSDRVTNQAGEVRPSGKQASQKKLEAEWRGHYRVVSKLDEILAELSLTS